MLRNEVMQILYIYISFIQFGTRRDIYKDECHGGAIVLGATAASNCVVDDYCYWR